MVPSAGYLEHCPGATSRATLDTPTTGGGATSPDERWFPSHLTDLDQADCLDLLAGHTVGRVAYCDELGPVVLPVNYVLDQGSILIRVSPHSTLAAHLRSGRASFEIDDYDEYNQSGWSVLVRGNVEYAETTDLPAEDDRPVAWPEGQRSLHVRITPHAISGRRLLSA